MKVCGLISGGKDSIYNLLECVRAGHEIVCLANLHPQNEKIQEMDSFCFQTIGHNVVEYIAEAMELPLVRLSTDFVSTSRELHYIKDSDKDEVEDLYKLLSQVQEIFPQVNAISSGAILSNYQRLRIENVCTRLNLTSLAYLWQRDQKELFNEMISSGMNAILVKVASMGLKTSFLNKSLEYLENDLLKLSNDFGLNVCGEGGEYESLTLDCPLYKKSIQM